MLRQQVRRQDPRALTVIASLAYRQRGEVRILAGQDLVEAELPLGMVLEESAGPPRVSGITRSNSCSEPMMAKNTERRMVG